jgi:hypothetical protein
MPPVYSLGVPNWDWEVSWGALEANCWIDVRAPEPVQFTEAGCCGTRLVVQSSVTVRLYRIFRGVLAGVRAKPLVADVTVPPAVIGHRSKTPTRF